tara:strand:+ start:80 stop:232 length:153 start_codon:yes stop_codon:yes gene_type:complete
MIKLTKKQEDTLQKHSKHHTSKHIRMMRIAMKKGLSFTKAHKKAQKEVGT